MIFYLDSNAPLVAKEYAGDFELAAQGLSEAKCLFGNLFHSSWPQLLVCNVTVSHHLCNAGCSALYSLQLLHLMLGSRLLAHWALTAHFAGALLAAMISNCYVSDHFQGLEQIKEESLQPSCRLPLSLLCAPSLRSERRFL